MSVYLARLGQGVGVLRHKSRWAALDLVESGGKEQKKWRENTSRKEAENEIRISRWEIWPIFMNFRVQNPLNLHRKARHFASRGTKIYE